MQVFGSYPANATCIERLAAYAVIFREDRRVAAVKGNCSEQFWLPGGGSELGESSLATVIREVREETDLPIFKPQRVNTALQYFYVASEDVWYKMTATFFIVRLSFKEYQSCSRDVHWLETPIANATFFHACHAWAVDCARSVY
jgi:8-oxo-dGTP pyrophosphatase MutT (NUDIX family)